jgi:CHAT domain/SMODS-associated and fused to various effectors sensor domain
MDYANLTIEISSTRGASFRAKVLEAPGGESPEVRFKLPSSEAKLARVTPHPDRSVRRATHAASDGKPVTDAPALPSYEEIGDALFRGLFAGAVGTLFTSARKELAAAARSSRRGLRIRLKFKWDDPQLYRLAGLPWELLWNPALRNFVARDLATPLVRDLDAGGLVQGVRVPPPLRVLLVEASPSDMHAVDTRSEVGKVQEAIRQLKPELRGRIKIARLRKATLDRLRKRLWREPFHVIHFMGHGGFNAAKREAVVIFEQPDGTADWVSALKLADHLNTPHFAQLRLVLLNSCESGAVPRWDGADPFTAAAPALLLRGVPAVVATQFKVTHEAAAALSGALYGTLLRGQPLETAVTEARLAISRKSEPEWPTPMLFLHAADGQVLSKRAAPRKASDSPRRSAPVTPSATSSSASRVLRLGISTSTDWASRLAADNDWVLKLHSLFCGRALRQGKTWEDDVLPRLRRFLRKAAADANAQRLPIRLDLTAHLTLAFAAGWMLEAKSGLDVTVRQRTQGKPAYFDLRPDDGSAPSGRLWRKQKQAPASKRSDVALAVSVTWPIIEDVRHYLRREKIRVGRTLDATISPRPGSRSVRGGGHALELAQELVLLTRSRSIAERSGTLHLFASAPNALLFYLGQLGRGLGRVQLYEHDFESAEPGAYRPSMFFTPGTLASPQ